MTWKGLEQKRGLKQSSSSVETIMTMVPNGVNISQRHAFH